MRLRVTVLLTVSALALVAAGCDSQQRDLISRALDQPINDAKVSAVASVTQAGSQVARVTVDGPFHSNGPGTLDSFDLNVGVNVNVLGSAHDLAFEAISTGNDVFVVYDGVTYEVGRTIVAEFNRRAAARAARFGNPRTLSDFERLGLNLDSWFPDSQVIGDETLNGDQVTHLHGGIDVAAVVSDLAKLMPRRVMMPQAGKAFSDPTFDVFVDKATGGFRRVALRTGLDFPGAPHLGLDMHVDLLDVGRPVQIEAPSGGRPIQDLLPVLVAKFAR